MAGSFSYHLLGVCTIHWIKVVLISSEIDATPEARNIKSDLIYITKDWTRLFAYHFILIPLRKGMNLSVLHPAMGTLEKKLGLVSQPISKGKL